MHFETLHPKHKKDMHTHINVITYFILILIVNDCCGFRHGISFIIFAGERRGVFATKQVLKINILQILHFSVRGGAVVGGELSGQYVGWSLQYAGFARLTRIGGLYCVTQGR